MRLYRYILRAHAGPFLFSFFTLMFIFLLQFIMKFVDQLVGKGLNALVIAELIILNLAWMVVLAVPMSVLVATLMGFGGLSSRNEITAMKASGMSLYRMMAPVIFMSILLALLLFEFYNDILPEANHRLKTLIFDIRRKKPTFTLVQGMFSQELPGYSILVRKTFEGTNDLEGVTIYDYTQPERNAVITAEQGKVSFTPDFRNLIMDLDEGEIHELTATESDKYQRIRFKQHRIVMDVEGFDFERSSLGTFSRGERELKAKELRAIVDSLQRENTNALTAGVQEIERDFTSPRSYASHIPQGAFLTPKPNPLVTATVRARTTLNNIAAQLALINSNNDRINENLVELYKKYAIPVACIVFVFIGAPLGVLARRGTFGMAATLSLGFFLVYWACLIGGEKLADRSLLSPLVGMWMANIIMGALGLYLTFRIGRETPQLRFDRLKRFIPKSLRSPEEQPTE
ncbi:MAG: LptF/LptG family permease [Ignavibacteriae bacterium]|nr:LptF/LptG family permease [Ignavibacteriota bacterium]